MKLYLECLELRLCPNAAPLAHPAVVIVGLGVNAQDYVPMTQAMISQQYDNLGVNQYGVGTGTIAAVITLPDTGPISDVQFRQLLVGLASQGVLPLGPNTLVMAYTPGWKLVDPIYQNTGGFNEGFNFGGQSYPDTIVWREPRESVAASHEYVEASTGTQIADAVNGQSKVIAGFNLSNFLLPSGQPAFVPQPYVGDPWQLAAVAPPNPPVPAASSAMQPLTNLFALAVERIEADLFGLLARVNPAFAGQADAAAQAVAANPLSGTAQGHAVEMQADAVFVAWVQLPR